MSQSAQGQFNRKDMPPIGDISPPPELSPLAERMTGLTGFVTQLCPSNDQRARVFCRYHHVRRVGWTAELLLRLSPDSAALDADLIRWFSWAHDLNRWPFAHNSETGFFDQAEDLPRFFADAGLAVRERTLGELQSIVNKDHKSLGPEARLVLLADIITGFVEDPLWLIVALNVTPQIVPDDVAEYLCLPLTDSHFINDLAAIARAFKPGMEPPAFTQLFDELFRSVMTNFVEQRHLSDPGAIATGGFQRKRHQIKERFMRSVVFPYNNELISHGTVIKTDLIEPLLDHLGSTATSHLTALTDESCLTEAVERSIISPTACERFYPNLDYMSLDEPESSFTHFLGQA